MEFRCSFFMVLMCYKNRVGSLKQSTRQSCLAWSQPNIRFSCDDPRSEHRPKMSGLGWVKQMDMTNRSASRRLIGTKMQECIDPWVLRGYAWLIPARRSGKDGRWGQNSIMLELKTNLQLTIPLAQSVSSDFGSIRWFLSLGNGFPLLIDLTPLNHWIFSGIKLY